MFGRWGILVFVCLIARVTQAEAQKIRAERLLEEAGQKVNNKDTTGYKSIYMLTDRERKVLSVAIDEKRISKPLDTIYEEKAAKFIRIPVTLQNNGSDTLKFYSMTCSWEEIYHIDNKRFTVELIPCQYNTICELSIPPKAVASEVLLAMYYQNHTDQSEQLRVGISINKTRYMEKYDSFINFERLKQYNIIWSNQVRFETK